jgi:hypothetical protein
MFILMMFSQLGDKKSTPPMVPSAAPKQTASNGHGDFMFGALILVLIVGFVAFVTLVAIPMDAKNKLQKEAERQASIAGPKVLAELAGEMRLLRSEVSLLRLAVENLAAQ